MPCQPLDEAFVLAAGTLLLSSRTALDARGIDAPPQVGQEAVGHEPAPRHRVEMQRLLVDPNLLLEAHLGDGDEGFPGVSDALGFDPDDGLAGDRLSEA